MMVRNFNLVFSCCFPTQLSLAEIALPPEFSVDPDAEDLSNLPMIWLDFLTLHFPAIPELPKPEDETWNELGLSQFTTAHTN